MCPLWLQRTHTSGPAPSCEREGERERERGSEGGREEGEGGARERERDREREFPSTMKIIIYKCELDRSLYEIILFIKS